MWSRSRPQNASKGSTRREDLWRQTESRLSSSRTDLASFTSRGCLGAEAKGCSALCYRHAENRVGWCQRSKRCELANWFDLARISAPGKKMRVRFARL